MSMQPFRESSTSSSESRKASGDSNDVSGTSLSRQVETPHESAAALAHASLRIHELEHSLRLKEQQLASMSASLQHYRVVAGAAAAASSGLPPTWTPERTPLHRPAPGAELPPVAVGLTASFPSHGGYDAASRSGSVPPHPGVSSTDSSQAGVVWVSGGVFEILPRSADEGRLTVPVHYSPACDPTAAALPSGLVPPRRSDAVLQLDGFPTPYDSPIGTHNRAPATHVGPVERFWLAVQSPSHPRYFYLLPADDPAAAGCDPRRLECLQADPPRGSKSSAASASSITGVFVGPLTGAATQLWQCRNVPVDADDEMKAPHWSYIVCRAHGKRNALRCVRSGPVPPANGDPIVLDAIDSAEGYRRDRHFSSMMTSTAPDIALHAFQDAIRDLETATELSPGRPGSKSSTSSGSSGSINVLRADGIYEIAPRLDTLTRVSASANSDSQEVFLWDAEGGGAGGGGLRQRWALEEVCTQGPACFAIRCVSQGVSPTRAAATDATAAAAESPKAITVPASSGGLLTLSLYPVSSAAEGATVILDTLDTKRPAQHWRFVAVPPPVLQSGAGTKSSSSLSTGGLASGKTAVGLYEIHYAGDSAGPAGGVTEPLLLTLHGASTLCRTTFTLQRRRTGPSQQFKVYRISVAEAVTP